MCFDTAYHSVSCLKKLYLPKYLLLPLLDSALDCSEIFNIPGVVVGTGKTVFFFKVMVTLMSLFFSCPLNKLQFY